MIEPGRHDLTEAMEGHAPAAPGAESQPQGPPGPTGPGSNPAEVAESVRRMQESQDNGMHDSDRETHMILIGRAQQTHG